MRQNMENSDSEDYDLLLFAGSLYLIGEIRGTHMSKNVKKVILFYNPSSGSGMFKNNLDNIIGRYQNEGYQVIPIRAAHGHAIL